MKYLPLFILFFSFSSFVYAQNLPLDRLYNWSNVGSKIDLPLDDNNTVINFATFSSTYPNLDFALSSALFQLAEGGTLFFPAGEYTFTQTVQVPDNVTLKGSASCETTLIFNLGAGGNAFNISGTLDQGFSLLSETANRKSNGIYLENPEPFSIGDWIEISFDDSELISSNWATNSVGQIAQIVNIQDSLIIIDAELRLKYELEKQAFVQKIRPRKGVTISSMKVLRNDVTNTQTSNFRFNYAVNCQIENVESELCNFAHIGIFHSAHLTIRNNYFHHAHNYGGGGKGYGIAFQFLTSECLIENNIFNNLRHSMLLQAGSNGNVLAYNYSTNPFWTGTTLPSNAAGDLVLHGNYVFANLAEGNVLANLVIDDTHGINGPHNTFLRNRAEGFGLFMNSGTPTDSVNFIGNETTGSFGLWWTQGVGHFQYGNNVLGEITPAAVLENFNSSFFTSEAPNYLQENSIAFPPVGFPNIPVQNILPAQVRYDEGYFISDCFVSSIVENKYSEDNKLLIFPNPSNGKFYWESNTENLGIKIFNLKGEQIKTIDTSAPNGNLDLGSVPNGIYFIEVKQKNGNSISRKIVINRDK